MHRDAISQGKETVRLKTIQASTVHSVLTIERAEIF